MQPDIRPNGEAENQTHEGKTRKGRRTGKALDALAVIKLSGLSTCCHAPSKFPRHRSEAAAARSDCHQQAQWAQQALRAQTCVG